MSRSKERLIRTAPVLTQEERNRQRAIIAAFRFGLGPKPGTIAQLSRTPTAAYEACLKELTAPNAKQRAMIDVGLSDADDTEKCRLASITFDLSAPQGYLELGRRFAKHLEPQVGFVERLVLFWANHFSINQHKMAQVRGWIGNFERTVIRRHVLGNYSDMLAAAISHPAMVLYLDNGTSKKTAVNENLAREILELYTVGTSERYPGRTTGYGQADVTSLARILTGWGFDRGLFAFRQSWHDEASHEIMGQSFGAAGQEKGFDALKWLASHPFTGEAIATKLLRHFVCDDPPASMVESLQKVFVEHNGDLLELSKALLQMEGAWTARMRLRTPHLWVVAQARALGFKASDFGTTQAMVEGWQRRLQILNHDVWRYVTPEGYPDRDSDWLHPNAMRARLVVANQILIDAAGRGRVLPAADTLRQQLLPGSRRTTSLDGVPDYNKARAAIADIFLSSEFMTR